MKLKISLLLLLVRVGSLDCFGFGNDTGVFIEKDGIEWKNLGQKCSWKKYSDIETQVIVDTYERSVFPYVLDQRFNRTMSPDENNNTTWEDTQPKYRINPYGATVVLGAAFCGLYYYFKKD